MAIVIEHGRIQRIVRGGDPAIPAGADVIDAAGKTVLPGFIDGHGHWEDFYGELYLHLGITTCATIELYQDGPWTLAQRDGTAAGAIRGPRLWTSGRAIGGVRTETEAPSSKGFLGNITVTTADEARAAVRLKKERGYDIVKSNEFLPADLLKVLVDEAHGLGLPVAAHSWDAIATANAGVDAIEHIWSVGFSSIADVAARRKLAGERLAGRIDMEIAAAYYEPENYDRIIGAMLENGVAFTPTAAKWLRPLSPSLERFRKRENEILDHPDAEFPPTLRAVTDSAYDKFTWRYTPEQIGQAKIGHDKSNEFILRFVEAGGRLKEGSDSPFGMAGLLMHQALVMDVEAGVSPMQAIESATLNVAKTFGMDKDFGSIEAGKVADLSIVNGNPLDDIWNTQDVAQVVLNGEQIDIGFHKYKNPIPSFYAYQTLPREIRISPRLMTEASVPQTLTVKGAGIWPFHRIMVNGQPMSTKYVSKSELQATIPAEIAAKPGIYIVTVKSEGQAIAESNRAYFVIRSKT
jgi:hypothetical protein